MFTFRHFPVHMDSRRRILTSRESISDNAKGRRSDDTVRANESPVLPGGR
jgi:hypothetical protein